MPERKEQRSFHNQALVIKVKVFWKKQRSPLMIRTSFLSVLLTIIPLSLSGQAPVNPRFEHITPEQGLPGRYVYSIIQDSRGFIWAGTSYGLARYDGYSIKPYRFDPRDSSLISDVFCLLEDSRGDIWIGSMNDGLIRMNVKSGQWMSYKNNKEDPNSLSLNAVWTIYEDTEETLWIGTYGGGLNKFDREKNEFVRFQQIAGDTTYMGYDWVFQIYEDSKAGKV
jgi:ligand-binding sensor domain-containing protein